MENLQGVGRGLAVSTSAYVTNIASRCIHSLGRRRILENRSMPEDGFKVLCLQANACSSVDTRNAALARRSDGT